MSDPEAPPHVIVLAGPNGAGKSTAAPKLLPHLLGVGEFVNADVIAQGLSAFAPEKVAASAAKIMIRRLRQLAEARASFALEVTLANRSLAPWLADLIGGGYEFELAFFYLPSADMAVARVAGRVLRGGHNVPEDVVRRRYERGLWNLFNLYIPLASRWHVYDNGGGNYARVAGGSAYDRVDVADRSLWELLHQRYFNAPPPD